MAQVFVVDRSAFFAGHWPQGFHRLPEGPDTTLLLDQAFAAGRFVDRAEAEANPAWKQWIPYCVLRCGSWQPGSDPSQRGVLLVQRTGASSETRLHESWSIGLGGHIEPMDLSAGGPSHGGGTALGAADFFAAALWRELTEELHLPSDTGTFTEPRLLGLINDDSTAVGRVHAGLAYLIDFPAPLHKARESVGIREISKLRGGFTSLVEFQELWQDRSQFETWSQFLIQAEFVGAMGGRSWSGSTSAENETGCES